MCAGVRAGIQGRCGLGSWWYTGLGGQAGRWCSDGPEKGRVIPGRESSLRYVWRRLSPLVLVEPGKEVWVEGGAPSPAFVEDVLCARPLGSKGRTVNMTA